MLINLKYLYQLFFVNIWFTSFYRIFSVYRIALSDGFFSWSWLDAAERVMDGVGTEMAGKVRISVWSSILSSIYWLIDWFECDIVLWSVSKRHTILLWTHLYLGSGMIGWGSPNSAYNGRALDRKYHARPLSAKKGSASTWGGTCYFLNASTATWAYGNGYDTGISLWVFLSSGLFFETHLKFIKLNSVRVPFREKNLAYLMRVKLSINFFIKLPRILTFFGSFLFLIKSNILSVQSFNQTSTYWLIDRLNDHWLMDLLIGCDCWEKWVSHKALSPSFHLFSSQDIYDPRFEKAVYDSPTISMEALKSGDYSEAGSSGSIRVEYLTKEQFVKTTKPLGLMQDFKVIFYLCEARKQIHLDQNKINLCLHSKKHRSKSKLRSHSTESFSNDIAAKKGNMRDYIIRQSLYTDKTRTIGKFS